VKRDAGIDDHLILEIPMASTSLLSTYLQFLRSPVLTDPPEDISAKRALSQILRLYTPHFLLVMAVGAVIARFSGAQDDSVLPDAIANMSALSLFLLAAVSAPILEEVAFRLPMRPFAVNLAFSGSLLAAFLLPMIVSSQSLLLFLVGALIGFNIYLWVKCSEMLIGLRFYDRYAVYIFYFLTLIFGAIHITNYNSQVWVLLPLLVLPQVIIALWLGFVRVRYGFRWAVFAHAFHNSCVLLPTCLTKLFGSAQLQADGLANIEMDMLTVGDRLLVAGIGVYVVGGVVVCVLVAWKLLQERPVAGIRPS